MDLDRRSPVKFTLLRGGVPRPHVADSPSPVTERKQRLITLRLPVLGRRMPKIVKSGRLDPPRYYNSLGRLHGLIVVGVGWASTKFLGFLGLSSIMQLEGGLYSAVIASLTCFWSTPGLLRFSRKARSLDSGYARGAVVGASLSAGLLMISTGQAAACTGLIAFTLFGAYSFGRLAAARRPPVIAQTRPTGPRRGA